MSDSVLLTDDQPVDPDDELLVAYLDDELDDGERKAVEKRLVAETEFQRRLQALQTGWEWLDELPDESTNEKLVESTIELLVADIVPKRMSRPSWLRKNWRMLAFCSVLVLSFLAGAIGANVQREIALTRDLEELAIAEDHEAYKMGENFSFFYQLAYNPRWQDMVKTMERVGQREMMPPSVVASIPLEDRDQALLSLPTETREKLTGRWEAYSGYGEETKKKLRQTALRVRAAEDSDKLLNTMKAASVWMEGLGEQLRDQMQSDDEAIRAQAINDAIDVTLSSLARDSGRLISDETSDQIFAWLRLLLQLRLEADDELAATLDRWTRAFVGQGGSDESARYVFLRMLLGGQFSRSRGPGGMRGGPGFGAMGVGSQGFGPPGTPGPPRPGNVPDDQRGRDGERPDPNRRPSLPRIPAITDQEYEDLVKHLLSDEARADLEALTNLSKELSGDDVGPVNATLRTWAFESLRRNSPFIGSNETTPLERYQEYKENEEFETFDLLPPEEILNEIYLLRPQRRSRGGRPR